MTIYSRDYKGKKQYRFRVGYKDVFGQSKRKQSKWFDKRGDCVEAEKMFVASKKDNYVDTTFEEMALSYIQYTAPNNTAKTQSEKRSYLRIYLFPLLNKPLSAVTSSHIKKVLEENEQFKKLSTSRKNRILGFVKTVFDHAKMFYGLDTNPVDRIPRFKKTDEEKLRKMNIYTPEEFNRFMDAFCDSDEVINENHIKYRNLFYVLYWTGMRLNEANSLTFNDVSQKVIELRKQFVDGKWVPLKTAKSVRSISIDKDIYDVIQEQYNMYKDMPHFTNDWFIFGGYKQLPHQSILRISQQYMLKAGLPVIRIHDFRHSHASYLIEAGVNIYKISRRLGHSSIAITLDRYGHLIDNEGDEILNAIKDKKVDDVVTNSENLVTKWS